MEALLIARELWERGEIKRLAVLCPPSLCDQWQRELDEKFNLEAVVVRSGTVDRLERGKPPTRTLYEHYPIQVISIDFVKSERNRHQFLLHAPDLVIVDEAHGATLTYWRAVPIWIYSPWRTCCASWREPEVNHDRHFCPRLRPAHRRGIICGGADLRAYPDDMARTIPSCAAYQG